MSKIRSGPQQRRTKSNVAASPLPSWGPNRGRKCYVTLAFSGIPNALRGEQNEKWSPTKGNKIRSGRLTPAVWGVPDASQRGTRSKVANKWPESSKAYFFLAVLKPSKKTGFFLLGSET